MESKNKQPAEAVLFDEDTQTFIEQTERPVSIDTNKMRLKRYVSEVYVGVQSCEKRMNSCYDSEGYFDAEQFKKAERPFLSIKFNYMKDLLREIENLL